MISALVRAELAVFGGSLALGAATLGFLWATQAPGQLKPPSAGRPQWVGPEAPALLPPKPTVVADSTSAERVMTDLGALVGMVPVACDVPVGVPDAWHETLRVEDGHLVGLIPKGVGGVLLKGAFADRAWRLDWAPTFEGVGRCTATPLAPAQVTIKVVSTRGDPVPKAGVGICGAMLVTDEAGVASGELIVTHEPCEITAEVPGFSAKSEMKPGPTGAWTADLVMISKMSAFLVDPNGNAAAKAEDLKDYAKKSTVAPLIGGLIGARESDDVVAKELAAQWLAELNHGREDFDTIVRGLNLLASPTP